MIVQEQPAPLFLPPSRTPRGQGVHLSSIIRCIATEAGILKPDIAEEVFLVDVREIKDPVAILRMSIGLAWEEWYIPTILSSEGVIDHPGEVHIDGIYMNPDGESLSVIITSGQKVHKPVLHEIKATYKSTRTVGEMSGKSEWLWRTQLQAYCKALNTTEAHLHVLFLCGDYSYPIRPLLKRFKIEFTKEELDMTWKLLTDYKDYHLEGR